MLPRIYPITDCGLSGKTHTEQVKLLVEGGAKLIQLREKNASSGKFYADALEALMIARDRKVKIIINDRCDIAYLIGADGVHLGQEDLPPEYARRLLGEDIIIGYSTHNPTQALQAVKMPVDYISVGPIFPTQTKSNPDPVVGLEGLREIRHLVGSFPIVAIGGITIQNAEQVLEAGASSVAVISDIVKSENIIEKMKDFASLLQ